MTLKQIRTVNIQSHKDITIDLPPTGLIRFSGKNSNGKTVIGRTILFLISGKLNRPRKRAALVNKNATFGEITMVRYDDVTLVVHITREASQTYLDYIVPGEEPVRRYLSDKNFGYYVKQFGWHYMPDYDISIQYADREDPMLFYRTHPKANLACINFARSDEEAEQAVVQFDEVLASCKSAKDAQTQTITACQVALNELRVPDISYLKIQLESLLKSYERLSVIHVPEIPELPDVVKASTVSFHEPNLPEVRYPRILPVFSLGSHYIKIAGIQKEIMEIMQNKCPTCGKELLDVR